MTRASATQIAFAIAFSIFVLDQALKWVVESFMSLGQSIPLLPGVVELTYTKNPRGAFGVLAGQATVLLAGSVMAMMVALWILLSTKVSRSTSLGCALILGGTAGNLLDRLLSGQVTDYVHLLYAFNAADFAIIAGIGVLFTTIVRGRVREPQRQGIGTG